MKHKHYSKKHAVHIDKHSGLIKQLYSQHSGYIPWEKHITVLLFASFGLFAFFSYDNYQTNKQFTIEINSQLHTSDFQMNESTRLARNNYFESYPEYREDALKNGISIGTHIYINPPLSNIYNGITNGLDIINKNPVEKFISTHLFQSLYIGHQLSHNIHILDSVFATENTLIGIDIGSEIAQRLENNESLVNRFVAFLNEQEIINTTDHVAYISSGSTLSEKIDRYANTIDIFDSYEESANYHRRNIKNIIEELFKQRDDLRSKKVVTGEDLTKNIQLNQTQSLSSNYEEYLVEHGSIAEIESNILVISKIENDIRIKQKTMRAIREDIQSKHNVIVYNEESTVQNKPQANFPIQFIKLGP